MQSFFAILSYFFILALPHQVAEYGFCPVPKSDEDFYGFFGLLLSGRIHDLSFQRIDDALRHYCKTCSMWTDIMRYKPIVEPMRISALQNYLIESKHLVDSNAHERLIVRCKINLSKRPSLAQHLLGML